MGDVLPDKITAGYMWGARRSRKIIMSRKYTFSGPIPLISCCPWSHGLWQRNRIASVPMPLDPVRIPSQWSLSPSVTSVKSVS